MDHCNDVFMLVSLLPKLLDLILILLFDILYFSHFDLLLLFFVYLLQEFSLRFQLLDNRLILLDIVL